MMTKEALATLRKKLPRGYQRRVVERLGRKFSQSYVHQVAHGDRHNEEILAELVQLAKETKEKRTALEQAIHNI